MHRIKVLARAQQERVGEQRRKRVASGSIRRVRFNASFPRDLLFRGKGHRPLPLRPLLFGYLPQLGSGTFKGNFAAHIYTLTRTLAAKQKGRQRRHVASTAGQSNSKFHAPHNFAFRSNLGSLFIKNVWQDYRRKKNMVRICFVSK